MQSNLQTTNTLDKHAVLLAQKAGEYGVSMTDFANYLSDEKNLNKLFADMRASTAGLEILKASAESIGARIRISYVDVNYAKPYSEAVFAGGPQTSLKCNNILQVADQYDLPRKDVVRETIILLNWPQDGSFQKALGWGAKNGLRKTVPHHCYALGEHNLRLNYDLGLNQLHVIETTGCMSDGRPAVCSVQWDGTKRKSCLHWQGYFGLEYDWFAFRR